MADVQKTFNPDHFRVKFRAGFAVLALIMGAAVVALLLLNETAQKAPQADFIAGFILATMIGAIVNFYYGRSETDPIEAQIPPPAEVIPEDEE